MNLLTETYLEPQLGGAYSHGHTPIDGIGSVVAMNVGGLSFPMYDHRGSVVRMTNANGSATDSFEYNAWGQMLRGEAAYRFQYQSNWMTPDVQCGRFYLSPTRIYDAKLGRFLQRDKLGGGYTYCANNPLGYVDPTGAAPEPAPKSIEQQRLEKRAELEQKYEEFRRELDSVSSDIVKMADKAPMGSYVALARREEVPMATPGDTERWKALWKRYRELQDNITRVRERISQYTRVYKENPWGLRLINTYSEGNTLLNTLFGTVYVLSDNLWPFPAGSDLAKVQSLLAELGFKPLPEPANGVYWTWWIGGDPGWTASQHFGLLLGWKAASFIRKAEFEVFCDNRGKEAAKTLWHELKAHNKDRVPGDVPGEAKVLAQYEKPVSDAFDKAEQEKLPPGKTYRCETEPNKDVWIDTRLHHYCCQIRILIERKSASTGRCTGGLNV